MYHARNDTFLDVHVNTDWFEKSIFKRCVVPFFRLTYKLTVVPFISGSACA